MMGLRALYGVKPFRMHDYPYIPDLSLQPGDRYPAMSNKRNKGTRNKRTNGSGGGRRPRAPGRNAAVGGVDSGLLQQALQYHQSGNLQLASQLYQQILASDPDHADANNLLGVIANQTGNNPLAVQLIARAIRSNPKQINAYNNLGVVLMEMGRPEEAVENYRKALSLKQNYPEAQNNCGIALYDLGRVAEAVACYRIAIAQRPNYAEAHNNLGNALRALGEYEKSVASYRKAISITPSFFEAYNGLGIALGHLGQWDAAIENYQQSLRFRPTYVEALNNLGNAFSALARYDEAIASYRGVIKNNPGHAEAHNNLGNALKAKGRSDEAAACYRSAISLAPSYTEAYKNLGVVLEHSGRLDDAIEQYRKAILLRPDYAEAYRHLSSAVLHTAYDDDIRMMERLYRDAAIQDEQRMHLCFALGKAYEDIGDYGRSFDFFTEANRIKRMTYTYTTADSEGFFARIQETFSTDFISDHMDMGVDDATPIFILGMPRSGTTLVEQILASHPVVCGAGELNYIAELAAALCPAGSTFPDLSPDLDADALSGLGADYLKRLREHAAEAMYITDKMPHNFLYIGLIKVALPNARIIHCRRDPLDNCLSIYKNYFADTHRYAYELTELGRYYRLYADLMQHWQQCFPGCIYDISYEALVAEQHEQTRRLLEYCGLPWDGACLRFHETERGVQTASSAQVRRPIYSDSVRLSERYGDRLSGLKELLG